MENMKKDIGRKIEEPSEEAFYNDVHSVLVIANKTILDLQIKGDVTTLKDISDQFPQQCLLVIVESPLGGELYRYNNYGRNEWIQVGKMYGYA